MTTREKRNAYAKKWKAKKKLEDPDYFKKWTHNKKENQKRCRDKQKVNNPTKQAERMREWRSKNREAWNEIYARYKRNRYKNDPNFRFKSLIRAHISNAFKRKDGKKLGKVESLLGCSLSFFKEYISTKFVEGMSWENRGKFGWHLDHIVPCSKFDLTNEEEVRKCFHYSNYQPLWWKDNLLKRDT